MQKSKRSLHISSSDSNLKKKLKIDNGSTQTNNLYNYFESNRKPIPQPKQSTLLSYFKREETNVNDNVESSGGSIKQGQVNNDQTKPDAFFRLMNPIKVEKEVKQEKLDEITEKTHNETARKCPFYKRIEGSSP